MGDGYFAKFPEITYANTKCVDLTRRVVIQGQFQKDVRNYYSYELKAHDLPDTVADKYYGDPYRSWLVYMSMGAVDPLYDWPLDDNTFAEFIDAKYGSEPIAKQKILGWRLDWSDVDVVLTPSGYASLPEPLKKYYEAEYGVGSSIMSWRRRQSDWGASTNIIAYLELDGDANGTFTTGERVSLTSGNTALSNSVIQFSNSSLAAVQDVFGNTENSGVLTGLDSGTTVTVTGMRSIANCIPIDERPFWAPTYAWDYEVDVNEQKKFVRLVDNRYASTISDGIRRELLK